MAAPVDADGLHGVLKGLVDLLLPQQPHPVARPLLGQHRHAPAGLVVAVAHDQVHVRIVGVPARLMDRGQPRGAFIGQALGKAAHEGAALPPVQFERQGGGELVDDPGVFAVGFFLRVQPSPRRLRLHRHSGAQHVGLRRGPCDVANMRPRRAGGMGAPADRAHVQAVDRDAGHLLPRLRARPARAAAHGIGHDPKAAPFRGDDGS